MPPEQRDLSMVFQDYALWPHLSARDNVAFALRRTAPVRARECRARAISRCSTGSAWARSRDRYPNELSGGEQQRVALARALIADTGLILCDEPLSNLDADLRERMRVEISALVREAAATTVYITHDQAEAFALADQVGVLEHGRLVQAGHPRGDLHPARRPRSWPGSPAWPASCRSAVTRAQRRRDGAGRAAAGQRRFLAPRPGAARRARTDRADRAAAA